MAAIISAQSGLSNATSTWVGGVVPVEGDTVTIAATHVVTITGTHIWGNDTATPALTIAGSCVFSTVANTDLTLKGRMVESGTTSVWRRGTIASPIPSGITSKVRTNYSATLANSKYNITYGSTSRFAEWSECGATRNRQFQVAAATPAGATSITVSDATGWQVGDIIFLEATSTTTTQREHRVLTSVSGNVVGWTTGLSFAHAAGCWGGNLSSNVLWQSYSPSFGASLNLYCQSTSSPATINIKQVAFFGMVGSGDSAGFGISGTNAVTVANSAVGVIDNIAGCDLFPDGSNATGAQAIFGVRGGYAGSWTYPTGYARSGGVGYNAVYTSSGGTGYFTNAFFCGNGQAIFSQFSQGGVGCKVVNSRITNINQLNSGASMIGFSMTNTVLDGSNSLIFILQGDYTFNNCLFGQTYGFLNTTQLIENSNNSLSTLTFNNCLVPSTPVVLPSAYQNALTNKPVTFINKNANPSLQEVYVNTGSIVRDNSQLYRSRSSIKFSPWIANTPHGYTFNVAGASGLPLTFKFGLRYDTTYGTATPPSVTVSGLGITPQTFTAGGSANTDYAGAITVTPASNGLLTITISGQTTSTLGTGNYWFSGMSINPWIEWTQWYGYAYLPTLSTLTVDPVVTLSESAAEALTGISFASGTLTVSGSLSISNVYDWMKWYESSNRLNPIITSADGKNFSIASNVVVSGTLTIPSDSALTPSGTFTLTGSLTGKVICNVAQATPTNLSGVTINGNLTYNTNTPITVTFTDCDVTGTISNSGSGLVKVVKAGTTPWLTVGSNVNNIASVVVETPGGLALSTYILKNGSTDLGWVATTTNRSLEIQESDTFSIYAIAYGYKAKIATANALDLTSFKFELLPEPFIDTSLSTTTRNFIASKFSTALDAYNRIALSLDTDLRSYDPDEVMNAVQYFITTQGSLIAQGVVYGGTIDGVEIINGGISIGTPGFYGKVNDSVTTVGDQGILVPIYVDVLPSVYVADPTYTPVKKNTSNIVLQTAPWTQQTADISAVDKTDIRQGLALEASLALKADQATVILLPTAAQNATATLAAINATPPDVNIAKINGEIISGTGVEADPWKPV